MSRIRGTCTGSERKLRSELHRRGLRFFKHVKTLPGRPDIVFPWSMVAVLTSATATGSHVGKPSSRRSGRRKSMEIAFVTSEIFGNYGQWAGQ